MNHLIKENVWLFLSQHFIESSYQRKCMILSLLKFHSNKSSLTIFFASKEDKDSLSMIQKLSIIAKILSAKDDIIF